MSPRRMAGRSRPARAALGSRAARRASRARRLRAAIILDLLKRRAPAPAATYLPGEEVEGRMATDEHVSVRWSRQYRLEGGRMSRTIALVVTALVVAARA